MKLLPITLALSLAAATPAAAKPLSPNDFGDGYDIYPNDGEPVQTLLLPLDIYKGVTRTDLGDIRVFNGSDEEVPHALRSLSIRAESSAPTLKLPIFPIRGAPNARLDDLTLHFSRSKAGTIVDIKSKSGGTAPDASIQAYLFDASADKTGMRRLRLKWSPAAKGFVARVQIEASDDLANWRTVASNVSVARLDYGGHSLERRSIGLPSVSAKYMRLTWGGGAAPFNLLEVLAELLTDVEEPERHTTTVTGTVVEGKTSVYQFNLAGPVPMDRAGFGLPAKNTLVQATLTSSSSTEGPWQRRWSGLLYRVVHEGQEMTSEPVHLAATADRHWRLEVDTKGGGLGKGLPTLEAAWLPQQLLFVARGDSPFKLAYGSYKAEPSTFDANSLLALVPGQTVEALQQDTVKLQYSHSLGGDAARIAPPPPPSWKVYILWGLLIVGVLLLGWMTVRLIKQLNATKDDDGEPSDAS